MFLTADHPHSALPPAEVEGRIRLYEGALEAEARKRRPHLPRIASLHEELARLYARRGDLHSALRHQREGQNVYRELAQQHPEVFLPGLARSLNDLSVWLSELGRREEALQAAREAVDLFRRLAPQRPQTFLPDLARSLGAYGSVLLDLGRASEACEAFAEGLRILLPFLRAEPAAFRELASALLQGYRRACEALGETPDAPLIREIFQNLVTPVIEPDVLPGSAP